MPSGKDIYQDLARWRARFDANGNRIPTVLWEAFAYAEEVSVLAASLQSLALKIDLLLAVSDGTQHADRNSIAELLGSAVNRLLETRPGSVCQRCMDSGKGFDTACRCRGYGWLPVSASTGVVASEHRRRISRQRKSKQKIDSAAEAVRSALSRDALSEEEIRRLPYGARAIARMVASGSFLSHQESSTRRPFRTLPPRGRKPAPPQLPPSAPESSLDS